MAERIVIDTDVLASEISTLGSVRSMTVTDQTPTMSSQGQTARVAAGLAALFMDLDAALNSLIDNTSAFLTNVMDGFVDADETAAAVVAQLDQEVGL